MSIVSLPLETLADMLRLGLLNISIDDIEMENGTIKLKVSGDGLPNWANDKTEFSLRYDHDPQAGVFFEPKLIHIPDIGKGLFDKS